MRRAALAFSLAILLTVEGCEGAPAGATGEAFVSGKANCDKIADIGSNKGINDPAGFLDPGGYETVVGARLKNEWDRKRVVDVAILPKLEGQDIDLVARCLGNRWAASGEISKNDILIVLAPNERRVRIATGTAAESDLTNEEARKIVDDMTRIFADESYGDHRYADGLKTGIDAIWEQTKGLP